MDDSLKEFLRKLGARIAEIRKSKGLTQEQLADAINVHRTYSGFIEQGKRNPTIGNLFKLSKSLGVSLADLFEEIDQAN